VSVAALAADSSIPEGPWGLAGIALLIVGGWVTAWLPHRKQKQQINSIQEQVVNNHGDDPNLNLRVQIDKLIKLGEDTREDVAELRGELKGLTHRVDQLSR